MTDSHSSSLHWLALAGVVSAVLGVLTGAMVTSSGDTSYLFLHEMTASVMAAVLAALGIWMGAKRIGGSFGWILLILAIAEGGLGHNTKTAGLAILHALLAQVLLALSAGAATLTSPAWKRPPDCVIDQGWPSLGSLAKITPVLVLFQIYLGAAFRHKTLGVLSHLFGAMVLVLVILCLCIFVMQQFPQHKGLRPLANLLMAVAFTQIFLGIGAFTVRTMTNKVTPMVLWVTAIHATVGGLTLACAFVLALQIRRCVLRKQSDDEGEPDQAG